MTEIMLDYLTRIGPERRRRLGTDSRRALRVAWPHRHTRRGRIVVTTNVAMLRNLREVK